MRSIYRLVIGACLCAGLALGCSEEKATTAPQGKVKANVNAGKAPKKGEKEMPEQPPPVPDVQLPKK